MAKKEVNVQDCGILREGDEVKLCSCEMEEESDQEMIFLCACTSSSPLLCIRLAVPQLIHITTLWDLQCVKCKSLSYKVGYNIDFIGIHVDKI